MTKQRQTAETEALDREIAALHEAGQAVAWVATGGRLFWAVIFRRDDVSDLRRENSYGGRTCGGRADPGRLPLIGMAGPAAEIVSDWLRDGFELPDLPLCDVENQLWGGDGISSTDRTLVGDADLESLVPETVEFVIRHWSGIKAAAELLVDRGFVFDDDVRPLVPPTRP